ncbi:hypothetical protein [Kineococcus rhizosphaerae]|uniref:SAF domain-containing protein n=1 Tax=Kineococcus rhizosphaerae TaxID=559628 RepID=A0A2T0R010_9ACTN|nr:hypothetical protein [Kineococcus rhizosphaerae]PRY12443.1 hypothetical protein CLV37_1103 [Kineococcus rhizosphaerae]
MSAPSWRDPRLLLGLLLILVSVVVGASVVGRARDTTGVWALAHPVGAGAPITQADLRVVQVHLDPSTLSGYVPASTDPVAGTVALRGLGTGELLPVGSLGRVGDLTSRPVTIPLAGNVPRGVVEAALVDVWVVPSATSTPTSTSISSSASTSSEAGEPRRLVEAAEVTSVVDGGGALASRSGADVQVLIPEGALPTVLRALSQDDDLVLVPVPGAGDRS